jgi:hypothetical protein
MSVRISYPHEAELAPVRFPGHSLSTDKGMVYLGTHFNFDVYVQTLGFEAGSMYCVYGPEEHEYFSAVGYSLVRTNRPPDQVPAYHMAAAVALLRNPEHIANVMGAHLE